MFGIIKKIFKRNSLENDFSHIETSDSKVSQLEKISDEYKKIEIAHWSLGTKKPTKKVLFGYNPQ